MRVSRRALIRTGSLGVLGTAGLAACSGGSDRLPGPNPVPKGVRPLPEWFEESCTHAHVRLSPTVLARDTATSNALDSTPTWIRELGSPVYTRHVKSQDENPWRLRINGVDPATYAAEASDDAGLSMIAYYTTELDAETAALHPEWICRQPDGTPNDLAYNGAMGTALDITTPYGDLVAQTLTRVIELGAKGIYLDRMLIPRGVTAASTASASSRLRPAARTRCSGLRWSPTPAPGSGGRATPTTRSSGTSGRASGSHARWRTDVTRSALSTPRPCSWLA